MVTARPTRSRRSEWKQTPDGKTQPKSIPADNDNDVLLGTIDEYRHMSACLEKELSTESQRDDHCISRVPDTIRNDRSESEATPEDPVDSSNHIIAEEAGTEIPTGAGKDKSNGIAKETGEEVAEDELVEAEVVVNDKADIPFTEENHSFDSSVDLNSALVTIATLVHEGEDEQSMKENFYAPFDKGDAIRTVQQEDDIKKPPTKATEETAKLTKEQNIGNVLEDDTSVLSEGNTDFVGGVETAAAEADFFYPAEHLSFDSSVDLESTLANLATLVNKEEKESTEQECDLQRVGAEDNNDAPPAEAVKEAVKETGGPNALVDVGSDNHALSEGNTEVSEAVLVATAAEADLSTTTEHQSFDSSVDIEKTLAKVTSLVHTDTAKSDDEEEGVNRDNSNIVEAEAKALDTDEEEEDITDLTSSDASKGAIEQEVVRTPVVVTADSDGGKEGGVAIPTTRNLTYCDTAKKAQEAEIAREAEKARLAALLVDECRRAEEETRLAEEARLAEMLQLEEETRLAVEREEAMLLAEEARIAEEALQAEEARIAEEMRLAEEAKRLEEEAAAKAAAEEEARLAEEERLAEEKRIAEEMRITEEKRLAEEMRIAEEKRLAEEVVRQEEEAAAKAAAEEEARLVEEARLAEEMRIAEEERLTEEKHIAEEERIIEEKRIAEEAAAKEEERQQLAEEKAAAAEAERLENERAAKAAAEAQRLKEEKAAEAEAKRVKEERAAAEAQWLAEVEAAVAEANKLAKAAEKAEEKLLVSIGVSEAAATSAEAALEVAEVEPGQYDRVEFARAEVKRALATANDAKEAEEVRDAAVAAAKEAALKLTSMQDTYLE